MWQMDTWRSENGEFLDGFLVIFMAKLMIVYDIEALKWGCPIHIDDD